MRLLILASFIGAIYFLSSMLSSCGSVQVLPDLPKVGTVKPYKNADLPPMVHIANKQDRAFCSGVVIDANYAVTAAHCAVAPEGGLRTEELRILDDQGRDVGIVAKAAGINSRLDYGIILGDFRRFQLAPFDAYGPVFAEEGPFAACGFAMGGKYLSCSPFEPTGTDGFFVEGRGMLIPGQSGGGVWNVRLKKVVGVCSAMVDSYMGGAGGVLITPLTGLLGAFGIEP